VYRFDAALDFSPLIGTEVIQVCIDQLSVIYRLHPGGSIASRGGGWRLLNERGDVVDNSTVFEARENFRVHLLLGKTIARCEVVSPERLRIFFSGFVLELIDDSDAFETHELVVGGEIVPV